MNNTVNKGDATDKNISPHIMSIVSPRYGNTISIYIKQTINKYRKHSRCYKSHVMLLKFL